MSKKTIKSCSFETPIEKHETASWANIEETKPVSNVSIPSENETRNAKDYVDSNEK
ncbi:CDIF630_02480 family spore surface protein [Clostridium magnum]|uniref:DUF3787 domain-containing protein n=1 Tax=Clostridium magnum DSM 2767 TaxID=1121326 RepID=A0A168DZL5_9CLOT|nr:DUF3787 domain-containing protein [Clostridium magnum]KZL93481.1 hypothetical protein CLMAG_05270 [Clostridium magnum DSM 2767]SHI27451.1 protein of unknown function [Clostridium magnum DSM 2767]